MKIDASGEDSLKTLADSNPMPLKKMKDKKRDIGFVVVRKRAREDWELAAWKGPVGV